MWLLFYLTDYAMQVLRTLKIRLVYSVTDHYGNCQTTISHELPKATSAYALKIESAVKLA